MNEQEQRIAIAEVCGVKTEGRWWCPSCEREVSPQMVHFNETHDGCGTTCEWVDSTPDYLHDLNAMHEAEKTLNEKQQVWYLTKLLQVRYRAGADHGMIACMQDRLAFATAAQRAEAFLKTLGKWKD